MKKVFINIELFKLFFSKIIANILIRLIFKN